jgi:hypothetical protein
MQAQDLKPMLSLDPYKTAVADALATLSTLKIRGAAFVQGAVLHKKAIVAQLTKQRSLQPNPQGCPHCGAIDAQYSLEGQTWSICTLHGTRWQAKETGTGFGAKASEKAPEALGQTRYLVDLYQDTTAITKG